MMWLLLCAGLTALAAGGELLVRGASRLALSLGVSPLVVGLTVVAYGTSAPEMAVSLGAVWKQQPDLVLGNAVGSNQFNVLFILGLCALIRPLKVSAQLVRVDVPIMIGVAFLLLVVALDGVISRWDGLVLLVGVAAYTVFLVRQSRRESATVKKQYEQEIRGRSRGWTVGVSVGLVLAGLGFCVLGGRWSVDGAVQIARSLGVSELVIGLTIVAAGTSLPEVVTSIVATYRGQRDIAIGNVVGSNIYNILGIVGVSSLASSEGIRVARAVLTFDIPVMIAVSVACLPIFFTGHVIARWEGGLFFGYYVAYTTYLVLGAQQHDALPLFSVVMWWFVVPLTVVTLVVVTLRSLRAPPPLGR